MNRFRYLIAATAVASLAACSTVLPTAHSGFLSDYTALAGGGGCSRRKQGFGRPHRPRPRDGGCRVLARDGQR